MSDAVFVTCEGFPELRKDMEESELSLYEYWKMVCIGRDGESRIGIRHTIQSIDACIEGRTTPFMREWRTFRSRYDDLTTAITEWRVH